MRQVHVAWLPERIVVLRALQLGDLLCAVPSLRALRAAYPRAHIALAGLPWASDFVNRFSHYLDEFIEFPGWPGLPEQPARLDSIPAFLLEMQRRQFHLALQMHGAGTITNPLVELFGARQAAGYYLPGDYQPEGPQFFPYPAGESEVRIFLQLMEKIGVSPRGEDLEFPVSAEERQASERFLEEHQIKPGAYACVHPGSRAPDRRWSPEKFARVASYLYELGLSIVLTCSQSERDLARQVESAMTAPCLNAAGMTGLGELNLLIGSARLLVSNDTGVSHLAAAVRTPSVILFSASDPARWQPLNRQLHRPVRNATHVEPESVMVEITSLLKETTEYARRPA